MENSDIYNVKRKGTNSTKWDFTPIKYGEEGLLPMWVADMDFRAPECVGDALRKMADLNVYGYYFPGEGYQQSFIDWERSRHGYNVKSEWLRYSTGVVSAIYWAVAFLTAPRDGCIILSPCYYPFMDAINENGRTLICCELKNDNGSYTIDLQQFEHQIIENSVKLFILCSPHNPVGRVWTTDELKGLMEICKKHKVFVVSDEVHQDIIIGDKPHIPTATIGDYSDMMITLTAASKTFNLAGCQTSFVIIENSEVRAKFDDYVKRIRVTRGSMFGYVCVEAAYRYGGEWLDTVLKIIRQNYHNVRDSLAKELPEVIVSELEGTYLLWIDLGAYVKAEDMVSFVQGRCRLAVDYGSWFCGKNVLGDTHIRLNLATAPENVQTAVESIVQAAKDWDR